MIKINREFLDENVKNVKYSKTSTDLVIKQMIRNSNYKVRALNYIGTSKYIDSLAVSVVGSRKMTNYGKSVVRSLVRQLVLHNITIVSGLMHGVDLEAHKTALSCGGRTIGVLGYGFNYLAENLYARNVAEEIMDGNGFIISEYDSSMPATRWTFPRRNNLVVSFSRATIVVEAGAQSGTSITANYTINQNKPLFVVPGSIFSNQSVGAHKLIKDGAILLDSISDVLNHLRLDQSDLSGIKKKLLQRTLKEEDQIVLKCLDCGDLSFEKIALKTKLSPALLNQVLTKLELNGILSRSVCGNWYKL